MATLADYEAALTVCVATPTPANAAAALAKHSLLPKMVAGDRASFQRPDPPEWVVNLAKAHRVSGSSIILGRPGYGDHR